ncbi:MAG: phosphotransferase family protein [Methylobacteriaceae bacterium]|jgi:thiamine kinase-like enzyme|nr:phosphotransferase family protein [Methylobacteriaceae bacterium]
MADMTSARAEAVKRLTPLPIWRGAPAFSIIEDGRTNCNFFVTDDTGRYFARFGVDLPHHFIFRDNERLAVLKAAEFGVAPPVLYAADGIVVSAFIDGRGLVIEDGADKAVLKRIAAVLRRLHDGTPEGIVHEFDLTAILPAYMDMLPAGTLDADDENRLKRIIASIPRLPPVSLAHSDLIPNNFMDDGERLWVIDWEYAGRGHPAIDLAMIVSNFDLTEELARYVIAEHGLCSYDEVRDMTPALIARELLWTLVQIGRVGLAGDLAEYREICLKRLRECPL